MDPRGPMRKLTKIEEIYTPAKDRDGDCITLKVFLYYDCGHVSETNPTFSYRVGTDHHCYHCGHPSDYANLQAMFSRAKVDFKIIDETGPEGGTTIRTKASFINQPLETHYYFDRSGKLLEVETTSA
jgi:hypothetical protein